jgi:CubicO group peptidase (beta-lactamase class C family)
VPDASITERLRKVTDREVPGIAVAVAGPEGLRETAAAGYADLADGEPASADMICPWFSMTKIVTATLAMRMAGRGLLNLDQPVLPLVPGAGGDAAAVTRGTHHAASPAHAQRRVRQPDPGPLDPSGRPASDPDADAEAGNER